MDVIENDSSLPLVWKDGSIVFVKLPSVIVVRNLIPLVKLSPVVFVLDTPTGSSVVAMVTCISELDLSSSIDSNVFEPREVD